VFKYGETPYIPPKILARLCLGPTRRDHRYIAIESGTLIVIVVVIGNARQSGHGKPDVYGFRSGTWPGSMDTTICESILSLLPVVSITTTTTRGV